MKTEVDIIAEMTKAVWYNQPLIVALVGGGVVAIVSIITNRYVVRPRYCAMQEEKCIGLFKEEINRTEKTLKEEINKMEELHEKRNNVSHDVFARKDVIGPQVKQVKQDMSYIRKRLDQLADDRRLPPVEMDSHEEG